MLLVSWIVANWRLVLFGLILAALGIQTARLNVTQADFAKYKAEIQKEVAENKAKAAIEQARMAHNAQESLDALTTRLAHVNAAYRVLRDRRSSPAVSSLASAASSLSSCPGNPDQPDSIARALERVEGGVSEILEAGDKELAKYVELWKLQQDNAGK